MKLAILVATAAPRATRPDRWLAALLLAVTLLAYGPALTGEFLLDDDVHVTRLELRSVAGLGRIWTEIGATQQYYPVLHTAFWIEHRLWGDARVGYHLVNVLQHMISAWLLVALMRRLQLPGGWLAAFAFALHPVAVESVAWISEQKNTLSLLFALGAAVAYLEFDDTRRRTPYAIATALFALALLSKTATATLPGVLLVLGWWRRGSLAAKRDLAPLIPWLVASVGAGAITWVVERSLIAGIDASLSFSGIERWLIAGRALWFYAAKIAWPTGLTFLYEPWTLEVGSMGQHVFPVAVLAGLVGAAWLARWRRGPLAAVLIFAGVLLPVLGFVNVEWFVFSFVADHFAYHALPVVIVPIAATIAPLTTPVWNVVPPARRALMLAQRTAMAAGGIALALLTWRHSATFQDSVALYRHAVRESPRSVVAHHHLGVALAENPATLPAAVAAFEVALALNPAAAETHANLGAALARLPGRRRDAIVHLETALRLKPTLAGVRRRLADAWFDEAKTRAAEPDGRADAIAHYNEALRHDPALAEAHFNLANALLSDGRRESDAIRHYEAAVRLRPEFVEARTNLGVVLARVPGRLREAIGHFEAALRANPAYAPARNNLQRARALLEATSNAPDSDGPRGSAMPR